MPTLVIAGKDMRLLLRDRRAAVILLVMPLLFILILGVALGEAFGQKPDDRLRVSVVIEDTGPLPGDEPPPASGDQKFTNWADVVLHDLRQTGGVRVEIVPDRDTAEGLLRRSQRAAVIVFGPEFSVKVGRSSFLSDKFLKRPGINPFFRDGIKLDRLNVTVLRDPTQSAASAIIEQVAQVTLLRVVLPWMIGRGFDAVSQRLPGASRLLPQLFDAYDLTAKTWARLTLDESAPGPTSAAEVYQPPGGLLARGSVRYQVLVPSYLVTFSFFLVLTCGWLFVTERRQGTLLRLRAAPLRRGQILLGKLLPCLAVSLVQGFFLLGAGKLVFGMNWGTQPAWLFAVVLATSIAATGLALLVASISRTESQVAVYGTLLVLVLAGISGALMPRELMPESMREWSKLTPHAWALDAYAQLLLNPNPDISVVATACGVLVIFGLACTTIAWLTARFD
ncbi:MAG: ABC transporter permease [Gemmataceae bacterium]